jgi:hypothetical protein
MRPFSMWLPVHTTRLLCGLFFIALLQGCLTVDVNVGTTDVCDKSKDPTGCNTSETWAGSAVGFKDTVTGVIIPTGSPLMCSGANSKRCNTTLGPGKCGFSSATKCINWYNPGNFVCKCDCP